MCVGERMCYVLLKSRQDAANVTDVSQLIAAAAAGPVEVAPAPSSRQGTAHPYCDVKVMNS